ncbi:MAG: hypothetical protein IIB17_08720, partial [Chloroflexi bacterium]|nr:hypothetical protein [Chloroflexota bacterium]
VGRAVPVAVQPVVAVVAVGLAQVGKLVAWTASMQVEGTVTRGNY